MRLPSRHPLPLLHPLRSRAGIYARYGDVGGGEVRTLYGCGEDAVASEVGEGAVWTGRGEGVWGALLVEAEGEVSGWDGGVL